MTKTNPRSLAGVRLGCGWPPTVVGGWRLSEWSTSGLAVGEERMLQHPQGRPPGRVVVQPGGFQPAAFARSGFSRRRVRGWLSALHPCPEELRTQAPRPEAAP
jgi:hypothetical protein